MVLHFGQGRSAGHIKRGGAASTFRGLQVTEGNDVAAFTGVVANRAVLDVTEGSDVAAFVASGEEPVFETNGISAAGDSRTETADGAGTSPWPTQFEAMTGLTCENHGHSGQGLVYLISVYASEVAPDYDEDTCNTAVCLGGINDFILGGADAATVRSRMQSWVALAAADFDRVGVATIPVPVVGALSGTVTSGHVAAIEAFNTALQADFSFADFLIDLADDARIATPPSTANNGVYYDGVHFTVYGAGVAAEIVATAADVTHVSVPEVAWVSGPGVDITTDDTIGAGWTIYLKTDDSAGFGSPAVNTSYTLGVGEDLNDALDAFDGLVGNGVWYATVRVEDASARISPWALGAGPRTVDLTPTFTGSFTDQTGVALSSVRTSATTITISGLSDPIPFTVTGSGAVSKNGGSDVTSGYVFNTDEIGASHTSSGSNSTATDTTFTAGGVSDTFRSTTLAGVSGYQQWKLKLNTTTGGGGFVVESLILKAGGVDVTSLATLTGVAYDGTHTAPQAKTTTGWWNFNGLPAELFIDFGSGNTPDLDEVSWMMTSQSWDILQPATMDIQYNNSGYVTKWSETTVQADWTVSSRKTFTP